MKSCSSFPLKCLVVATVITVAHPGAALAQDATNTAGGRSAGLGIGIPQTVDLHGYVGLAAGVSPEYEGGNDAAAMALPMIDIRQQDFLFVRGASTNPNDGYGSVGWYALNFGYDERRVRTFGMSIGPVVRLSRGRDEGDSGALDGLGNISDSVSAGGFFEVRAGDWSADISAASQDAGKTGDGLLVSIRSSYTTHMTERFSIAPGIFTSWGDDDYMQGRFGVNASQAARSGYSRFSAQSGFKDVGGSLHALYAFSDSALLSGELGYQHLLGDAADSPIVNGAGAANQYRALLGIAYKF